LQLSGFGYKQSFGPLHPVFFISSLEQMKPDGVVVCVGFDVGVVVVSEVADDDCCEGEDDGSVVGGVLVVRPGHVDCGGQSHIF
jgi:hypothetical protein